MNAKIIRITKNNQSFLNCLDEEIFDEKVEPEKLQAYAADPNHIMLVAQHNHQIIGQILGVIHRHPDKATELYIDDLAVSESFQRNGIATQLAKKLIELGKRQGCEEIWVATEPDNTAANLFYRSLNLTPRSVNVFEGVL